MSHVRNEFGLLLILSLLLAWTPGATAAESDFAGPAGSLGEPAPVLPEWLEDVTWGGDLRLRYHGENFGGTTIKERHQGRFRLRIWAKKTWLEKQIEAGLRLASGSSNSPTSTNQSFDTTMSEKDVWIDRAYAKIKPASVPGLEVVGGKMANPFLNHTNVVWDSDVNPEGVWAVYTCPFAAPIEPFVGAGYFLTEESATGIDGTLTAYLVGVMIPLGEDTEWTTSGTYYDWRNYETTFASVGNTTTGGGNAYTPVGPPAGATLLTAQEFDVVDITTKLKTKIYGVPVSGWFVWAHNTENVLASNADEAYGLGMKVGQNKKAGDLSGAYKYAYIEQDAVPAGLNDSDFGTTNVRGHEVGLQYNVTDSMTVRTRLFYTETILGPDNPRLLGLFDVIFKW